MYPKLVGSLLASLTFVTVTIITLTFTTLAAETCPSDINLDSTVDINDFQIFKVDFLKNPFSTAKSDINADAKVDIFDYALLFRDFGKTCSQILATPAPVATPPNLDSGYTNTPACKIYAVHDQGDNNTQFFTIDPSTNFSTSALGSIHLGLDIEDIDIHPQTNVLYGTVGSNSTNGQGKLYVIHKDNGDLTLVGDTGINQPMPSLSFRNVDNTLWSFANNYGLVTINPVTAQNTLVKTNKAINVQAIVWNNNGDTLYLTVGNQLWTYNYQSQQFSKIYDNLPGTKVEAMSVRPDGLLMMGHDAPNSSHTIIAFDPVALTVVDSDNVVTPYYDVEGIAWPDNCTSPSVDNNAPSITPTPLPELTPSPTVEPTSPAEASRSASIQIHHKHS